MNIDTLTVVLQADGQQFTATMENVAGKLRQIPGLADRGNKGLQALRGGFQALAYQATGVSGPIGKISSGLLMLAGGSTLVLGVVAGAAAIAGAWKLATAELTKFNKATEDAIARGHQLLSSAHDAAVAQRAAIQGQLVDVQAELDKALHPPLQHGRGGTRPGFVDEVLIQRLNTRINELTLNLGLAQRAVDRTTEVLRSGLAKGAEETAVKVQSLTAEIKKYVSALKDSILEMVRLQRITSTIFAPFGFMGTGPTPGKPGVGVGVGGSLETIGGDKEIESFLNEKVAMPTSDLLKQAGYDAGRQFVEGLIQGTASLEDVLKNFILGFIGNTILGVIGQALGIASPSRVAMAIGRHFSTGLAMGLTAGGPAVASAAANSAMRMTGGATFNLNVTGMPRAGNPLAAARDGEWQRFLRESNLVARGDGFKFA